MKIIDRYFFLLSWKWNARWKVDYRHYDWLSLQFFLLQIIMFFTAKYNEWYRLWSKSRYKCFEAFDGLIRRKNFINWSVKKLDSYWIRRESYNVLQPVRKQDFILYRWYEAKSCFLIDCRASYDAHQIQCEFSISELADLQSQNRSLRSVCKFHNYN